MSHPRTHLVKDVSSLTKAEATALDALLEHEGRVTDAARALNVSAKSFANRMQSIREKLGAKTAHEAIAIWRGRKA
jgi:DNA-binding CsgD family transcriptional regulator